MTPDDKKFVVEPMTPGLDDVSVDKEVASNPDATLGTMDSPSASPVPDAETQAEVEALPVEAPTPRGSKRLAAEQAAGRATLIRKFGYSEGEPVSAADDGAPKGKRKRK